MTSPGASPRVRAAGLLALLGLLASWSDLPQGGWLAKAEAGDEPPAAGRPRDAIPHIGMPPYLPRNADDPAAVRSLCRELVAQGRTRVGTREGGDFLYAAAHATYADLGEEKPAMRLYAEAAAAYPPDDPTQAVVMLQHAQRACWRGNVPRAKELLGALDPWVRARPPRDLSPADAYRWQTWAGFARRDLPRVRAEVEKASGRPAQAADVLQSMLDDASLDLSPARRKDLLEQIARLRYRARDKEGALRAIDAAIELAETDRDRAYLPFWRLHARHGLIGPSGAPVFAQRWPGEAYANDARDFLRGIQGLADTTDLYFMLASSAYTGGQLEFALEIYLLAMRDPAVVAAARGVSANWRGLLMAYAVAEELGRYEDAERILDTVSRIADEPIPEIDEYRIAIREGRARRRAEGGAPQPAEPKASGSGAPRTQAAGPIPLGGIETGRIESGRIETGEGNAREPRRESPTAATPSRRTGLWALAGVLGLLCLWALLRLRRR